MEPQVDKLLIDIFGEDNLRSFHNRQELSNLRCDKLEELSSLRQQANDSFKVDLNIYDIMVACAAGVLLGLANALFKDYVPKHGPLSHSHDVTRTGIDYQIPKPEGYHGSVQDLHRQMGPGHDLFRFNEALGLMDGSNDDFSLWGSTANEILGHELRPGNLPLDDFRALGGFRIPENPRSELLNHLLIDFFTRRSLPIPGSTYIADSSPAMAKLMLTMYDNGLNLKTALGNGLGYGLVQIIVHGYAFMYWAVPESKISTDGLSFETFKELLRSYKHIQTTNKFYVMMVLAHGSSFLVDTIVTTSSKAYAGLFQLNYISLMAFATNLIKYILQSQKDLRIFQDKATTAGADLRDLDTEWYQVFHTSVIKASQDDHFIEIFDSEVLLEQHNTVIEICNDISSTTAKQAQLYKELEDL